MDKLSEFLKNYRKTNNLTLMQMANKLGVPIRTYENWEYGVRVPDDFKKSIIIEKLK